MANETVTFGVSTAVMIVGLAILLYGVSLNDGQAINTPFLVGGVVILVAVGLLTAGTMALEDGHGDE